MNIKTLNYVKLVMYILCFASLALPMNFDAHTGHWILGINYVINLFSQNGDKEAMYWFFYYLILYIMPSVMEIVFFFLSKRGVISDIFDVLCATVCATVMFCFYISLKHSPVGIIVVMSLQAGVVVIACIRLVVRIFLQNYFDEMTESKIKKF